MTTSDKKAPPHKAVRKEVLLDEELANQAEEKAQRMGWSFGSVARALFRLWVQEDVITSADVGAESEVAPKKKRRKKGKKQPEKPSS